MYFYTESYEEIIQKQIKLFERKHNSYMYVSFAHDFE